MHLRPVALLFGDSITEWAFGYEEVTLGWASLLAAAYFRRADVLNRGFCGYNTQHALEVLPRVFQNHNDKLLFVTLLLGSNDCSLPGQRQHIPLEDYHQNLGTIIQGIQERIPASCPIIVMTPPPIDTMGLQKAWAEKGWADEKTRTNESARMYGLQAKTVAQGLGCPVLDLWEFFGGDDLSNFEDFLSDGLHLSNKGNQKVCQGLLALIREKYPHLAPEGIPQEEKLWDELC